MTNTELAIIITKQRDTDFSQKREVILFNVHHGIRSLVSACKLRTTRALIIEVVEWDIRWTENLCRICAFHKCAPKEN